MEEEKDLATLLVIDDDETVRDLVAAYGEALGWTVVMGADAQEGLDRFHTHHPDVVVLDLMLPDASGWTVLAAVRRAGDTYVVLLTAKDAEADRIAGLTRGADDYVVKPFSPGELLARCQALLRRPRDHGRPEPSACIAYNGLTIDRDTYEARLDGERLELSALEFQLLHALLRRPGRVFTRDQLADLVWGAADAAAGRVVDVHIGRLRRKLGDVAEQPRFIETVRGVGYRLRARSGPA